MRVYVDINIVMDYLMERDRRSEVFFENAIRGKYVVVISDWTLHELKKNEMDATNLLNWLNSSDSLEFVFKTPQIVLTATQLAKVFDSHYEDAIHIALAEYTKADCLLTQNIRDFRSCHIAKNYTEFGIK